MAPRGGSGDGFGVREIFDELTDISRTGQAEVVKHLAGIEQRLEALAGKTGELREQLIRVEVDAKADRADMKNRLAALEKAVNDKLGTKELLVGALKVLFWLLVFMITAWALLIGLKVAFPSALPGLTGGSGAAPAVLAPEE